MLMATEGGMFEKNTVIIGGDASIAARVLTVFGTRVGELVVTHRPRPLSEKSPPGRHYIDLDLSNDNSIREFGRTLTATLPRVDVAIFLAGLLLGKSLEAYSFEEIDSVMTVNFSGQVKALQQMWPLFHSGSTILLFSSISAQRGSFDPIYAASKGAVLSFVKSMASKLPPGARINAVAPGLIEDSKMFSDMTPDRREFHRSQVPARRLLSMEDLAEILVDLCKDSWGHLNGACIDLNGGQYVR